MKTTCLLLFLISIFSVHGQVVTLTNKVSGDLELLTKTNLIVPAFTEAIKKYTEALGPKNPDHQLKKTIGAFQTPVALASIASIDLTVMVLEKDDTLDIPTTWKLPTFFGKRNSYVTKIPYSFMERAEEKIRFEHLALHELGHIVAGEVDHTNVVEEERHIEYIVYLMVGREKYIEFIRAWMRAKEPRIPENILEKNLSAWMDYIGATSSNPAL